MKSLFGTWHNLQFTPVKDTVWINLTGWSAVKEISSSSLADDSDAVDILLLLDLSSSSTPRCYLLLLLDSSSLAVWLSRTWSFFTRVTYSCIILIITGTIGLSVVRWWRAHYLRRRREEAMNMAYWRSSSLSSKGFCVSSPLGVLSVISL